MRARVQWSCSLVLLLATLGCRSAGTGADLPATPAATTESAAAKPIVIEPEWEATRFADDQHGFSFYYPVDFEEQPTRPGGLFSAASPMQVPRVDVTVSPVVASPEVFAALLEQTLQTVGGGDATVSSRRAVELRDGTTPAMETVAEWTFQGFPLQSLVLSVENDAGELVSVMVTGLQGEDVGGLAEIAYTLALDR